MTAPLHLGFDQLDEIAYAASFLPPATSLPEVILPSNLGPLVELYWLFGAGLKVPNPDTLNKSRRLGLVKAIISGKKTARFQTTTSRAEFMRCYWRRDEQTDDWHFFCRSMQAAAVSIGFPRQNAEELVAAVRELVANIYDHSGAPQTGVVGFAAVNNEFEFVVADKGIGVLESLRSSSEFNSLRDVGEAIETALTEGTSRYGKASGHGNGFRDLFRGLGNLSSNLRFRSGDHALTINGISPGLSMGRISQKTELPGFVVSVVCLR
jgi:hypothetical protein